MFAIRPPGMEIMCYSHRADTAAPGTEARGGLTLLRLLRWLCRPCWPGTGARVRLAMLRRGLKAVAG